mmetsp:Transcript_32549/g.74990  ORF Transcript_32549/g.74990 Transcript_32549/m.74990 type:complete len:366 (-) Transcript_32549:107-1204(-)
MDLSGITGHDPARLGFPVASLPEEARGLRGSQAAEQRLVLAPQRHARRLGREQPLLEQTKPRGELRAHPLVRRVPRLVVRLPGRERGHALLECAQLQKARLLETHLRLLRHHAPPLELRRVLRHALLAQRRSGRAPPHRRGVLGRPQLGGVAPVRQGQVQRESPLGRCGRGRGGGHLCDRAGHARGVQEGRGQRSLQQRRLARGGRALHRGHRAARDGTLRRRAVLRNRGGRRRGSCRDAARAARQPRRCLPEARPLRAGARRLRVCARRLARARQGRIPQGAGVAGARALRRGHLRLCARLGTRAEQRAGERRAAHGRDATAAQARAGRQLVAAEVEPLPLPPRCASRAVQARHAYAAFYATHR